MRHRGTSTAASIAIADAPESSVQAPIRRDPVVSLAVVMRLLMLLDGASILLAGVATVDWRVAADGERQVLGLAVALGAVLGINALYLLGVYRPESFDRLISAVATVAVGWLLSLGAVLFVALLIAAPPILEDDWFVAWFAGALALLVTARVAVKLLLARWQRDGRMDEVVAVLGAGPIARRLLLQLAARPDANIRVAGVYREEDDGGSTASACLGHRILGDADDLVADIRRMGITTVIVAMPLAADLRLASVLNRLSVAPVDVRLCPEAFGLQLGQMTTSHMAGMTLLNVIERPLRDWRLIAKAVEDRVLAALILALIAPLMLVLAAAIKLDSPGPVFFRQKRYGFNNRLIEVMKFRTMYHEARDEHAEQLTRRDDPRVTRFGAFLRRTSLDELPQFINVLRGEMSIVGPRPHALAAKAGPLLYQDAVRYYDSRHRMKPGITGWAQINGWRGETDTVEKIRKRVEHDLYYIENWSIGLDLRIILRTVFGGFTGRHAY